MNGKTEQFVTVLESHKGILYTVANAYCAQKEDREDIIQEMIYQLWRTFENYSAEYKYSTWIYRVALNVAISFYRKEKRRRLHHESLSDDILNIESPPASQPEDNIRVLQQFIAQLKDMDKALMLLYLGEKSQREMSQILGISESNVSTRINRVKKILLHRFSTIK